MNAVVGRLLRADAPLCVVACPLCSRNASAEDQLYGTWETCAHFTEEDVVPDYVAMVERFVKQIHTEGLLENVLA